MAEDKSSDEDVSKLFALTRNKKKKSPDAFLSNIIPFRGEEYVDEWIDEFEQITEAAGVMNEDRYRLLPMYLKGNAKEWYNGCITCEKLAIDFMGPIQNIGSNNERYIK